jgi:Raf kinase inhibitor-like YbhB/YbcL family protein
MRTVRVAVMLVMVGAAALALALDGQTPPSGGSGRGGAEAQPQRGRGRGGRGAIRVMTLTTTGWADGGRIPLKHAQAGDEVSPPLAWSNAPDGTASFTLIVHDTDAAAGGGTDDVLHWMVWNIPGTASGLPEAVAQGPQLPDGARQISVSGPYYRGPAAAASDPAHHYVFELYALDAMLDVPAVGASPAETRAAVLAAMTGHVRGKAVVVGLFKPQ